MSDSGDQWSSGSLTRDDALTFADRFPATGDWSILLCYRGSVAHGMFIPSDEPDSIDDIDLMGFCVPPLDHYFGLREFGSRGTQEIVELPWDVVVYEARKAIGLLAKGNPNVVTMLWLEPEHYLKVSAAGQLLLDNRGVFDGKHIHESFGGYARDQLSKLQQNSYGGHMGEKRRKIAERHGYDPKNAAHLIRLLRMDVEYLRTGELAVMRPDADELVSIKRGEWTLDQVKAESARLFIEADAALASSRLPEAPDEAAVNELCVSVIEAAQVR